MHYLTTDDHEEDVRLVCQDKAEGMRNMPGISDEVHVTEIDNQEFGMAQNWTLGGEIDVENCELLRLVRTTSDMPEDKIKQYVENQAGPRSWCDTVEAPTLEDAIKEIFEIYDGCFTRVVTPGGKVFDRTGPVST